MVTLDLIKSNKMVLPNLIRSTLILIIRLATFQLLMHPVKVVSGLLPLSLWMVKLNRLVFQTKAIELQLKY